MSSTRLRVTSPAHAAGAVHVRVVTRAGTSARRAVDRFTYVGAPVISAVAPATGRTAGGTRVTITGARFVHVTGVRFGTSLGTSVTVLSPTRLQVTAPARAAGRVDIRVTTRYGTSAVVVADRYRYAMTWGAPQLVDPVHGVPSGVSCPTATFCVVVARREVAVDFLVDFLVDFFAAAMVTPRARFHAP